MERTCRDNPTHVIGTPCICGTRSTYLRRIDKNGLQDLGEDSIELDLFRTLKIATLFKHNIPYYGNTYFSVASAYFIVKALLLLKLALQKNPG